MGEKAFCKYEEHICKRYGLDTGYTGVQKRHGCRWFRAETKFRKEAIAPF